MRGDDGVGPVVAAQVEEALDESQLNRCRVLITHQLTPELALELSESSRAILIDARIPGNEPIGVVRVDTVSPEQEPETCAPGSEANAGLTHHWTFPRLLAMAKMLFGQAPTAYTVSVSASDFDHTDQLSPSIREAVPIMQGHVMQIIRSDLGT